MILSSRPFSFHLRFFQIQPTDLAPGPRFPNNHPAIHSRFLGTKFATRGHGSTIATRKTAPYATFAWCSSVTIKPLTALRGNTSSRHAVPMLLHKNDYLPPTSDLIRSHPCIRTEIQPWNPCSLILLTRLPCIRLARGRFELTNQDSVGGKNASVLSDVKLTSQQRHWNQATFLTGDGIKYPRKRIYHFKNQTSWQKVKYMNHFVFLSSYFGAKNGSPALDMATRS